MTKRQKITILKKALKLVESGECDYICHAIGHVLGKTLNPFRSSDELEPYGITIPHKAYIEQRVSWWPVDLRGKAIRIRVLKNAIKRLQK